MIKKNFIGLSTLLLVLLLGLFSTSYAYTENEVKNFILNSFAYDYTNGTWLSKKENVMNFIENNITTIQTIASVTESYNYVLMLSDGINCYIFMSNSPIYNNGNDIIIPSPRNNYVIRYNNESDKRILNNQWSSLSGFSTLYSKYACDHSIYTGANNTGSIRYQVGSNPVGILEGTYQDNKFVFSPTNTNFQVCSINGLVEPSEVYVYDRNNQDYLTMGYLEKFSNLDNITISRYRYTKSNGWVETSVNAFDDFSGYNVQDDILTYTIDVSKISADTLVIFNFTPKDIETFSNQVFALYVKSPYTFISNGVIYPSQTFSGDYFNNYNDDSNTDKIVDNNKSDSDKIIDTLTDDSQVDGMLSELVSGDAEDIAKKFGFTLFNRYYYDFIHDTIEDIVEVLEQDGDVYFDYSMHGEAPTRIYASQFTTPDGPLKTFLSMFLIACTVFSFYKYIADIIELISTGNILEALQEFKIDRNIFKM